MLTGYVHLQGQYHREAQGMPREQAQARENLVGVWFLFHIRSSREGAKMPPALVCLTLSCASWPQTILSGPLLP